MWIEEDWPRSCRALRRIRIEASKELRAYFYGIDKLPSSVQCISVYSFNRREDVSQSDGKVTLCT